MPSDRKQVNVRVDAATEDLMARLLPVVSAAIGIAVSQSDLFRLGLIELEKKFAPPPAPEPQKKRRPAAGR